MKSRSKTRENIHTFFEGRQHLAATRACLPCVMFTHLLTTGQVISVSIGLMYQRVLGETQLESAGLSI